MALDSKAKRISHGQACFSHRQAPSEKDKAQSDFQFRNSSLPVTDRAACCTPVELLRRRRRYLCYRLPIPAQLYYQYGV